MNTQIAALETEVSELRVSVADHYNAHRDATDRLFNAERSLAEARKNGDNPTCR